MWIDDSMATSYNVVSCNILLATSCSQHPARHADNLSDHLSIDSRRQFNVTNLSPLYQQLMSRITLHPDNPECTKAYHDILAGLSNISSCAVARTMDGTSLPNQFYVFRMMAPLRDVIRVKLYLALNNAIHFL